MTNAPSQKLTKEKSRLEAVIDRLDTGMLLSILAVVIGLIIEYLFEFIPKTDPTLLSITHKVGGGIVTLGVSGELIIEYFHGKQETKLREINDAIIGANTERVAELNLEAEKERLARVNIEQRLVRWTIRRKLDQNETDGVQEQLKQFAGQRFGITHAATDDAATSEPLQFAMQLRGILQGAGWVEERIPSVRRVGNGVLVECNSDDMDTAVPLARALASVGIQAMASGLATRQIPPIRIHVGLI